LRRQELSYDGSLNRGSDRIAQFVRQRLDLLDRQCLKLGLAQFTTVIGISPIKAYRLIRYAFFFSRQKVSVVSGAPSTIAYAQ